MSEYVCMNCHTYFTREEVRCPHCHVPLAYHGANKNVLTAVEPDCYVHRYRGSDLLEPAVIVSEGRVNYKVALRLSDYAKPIAVPKTETFAYQPSVWDAIEGLRKKRTDTIRRYDEEIAAHWARLIPYSSESSSDTVTKR